MNNRIFKPTPLYKEFMILDIISKREDVTQRSLSRELNISVSMVNEYLEEYEKKGYIKKVYKTVKSVKYIVTKEGIERKKYLNIGFLEASFHIYASAKENIIVFINQIIERGFTKILFYGAGEVAEIMLNVIVSTNVSLTVLAVIDDNSKKQGKKLLDKNIIPLEEINKYDYDGVLISSYNHSHDIYEKLINLNIQKEKILRFFEE